MKIKVFLSAKILLTVSKGENCMCYQYLCCIYINGIKNNVLNAVLVSPRYLPGAGL